MELTPGSRWRSAVDETEVVIVRAPGQDVSLCCGGKEMVAHGADVPPGGGIDPELAGGTLIGKRYTDPADEIEVLCTKGGTGSLSADGATLSVKNAKPLPASD